MANDIIRSVLEAIRHAVDDYLQNLDHRAEDWVLLTSLLDQDGAPNPAARDRIVMTVCNLTPENMISTYQPVMPASDQPSMVAPSLYLDVHLMFTANFTPAAYADGLAALSRVIAFFQQRPVLTPSDTPRLPPAIDKLSLELENLGPEQVHQVMAALGARYQPSAFYKLRVLPFGATETRMRSYPDAG